METLRADFLLCSAYKFYGPHVGILYSRGDLLEQLETDRLRTQSDLAPYRIETGTLNHAAIVGIKAAVEYIASLGVGSTFRSRIVSAMDRLSAYEYDLAKHIYEGLGQIPGVVLYGPGFNEVRRAPTVSFVVKGKRPSDVARQLGKSGLLVWDGDFYAIRATEVLGVAETGGWIRVGMSLYNTLAEAEHLLHQVARLAR
jgi:selenocysteine lyase/cysteine desulfurase